MRDLSTGIGESEVCGVAERLQEVPEYGGKSVPLGTGDAGNVEDVVELSAGQDLVISATRPAPGNESELVTTTKALLTGLARTGVRLLVVGGAGSLTVPGTGGTTVIDDPRFLPAAFRDIALACTDQLEACRAEAGVDWAYLSPAAERPKHHRTRFTAAY